MHKINGIEEIITDKKAVLCDLWGVLHNGDRIFPGAIRALENLRARKKPVILLSNSPKPAAIVKDQIAHLGIQKDLYQAIVSSGQLVRDYLKDRPEKSFFFIGEGRDQPVFEGLDNPREEDLRRADLILCTGFFEGWGKNPETYEAFLSAGVENGTPFVCANPDTEVYIGEKKVPCAGALAKKYEALGGKVLWFGKPERVAYKKSYEFLPGTPEKNEVLVIGDNLATDILGAKNQGMESVFITEGLHGKPGSGTEDLESLIKSFGFRPDYYMPKLDW